MNNLKLKYCQVKKNPDSLTLHHLFGKSSSHGGRGPSYVCNLELNTVVKLVPHD